MTVAELIKKMVVYSEGNLHDIAHFLKVYAYAKTIGECEHLDKDTQLVLEIAAVLHDIACPLCREKYGSTDGKYQEREGAVLAADFLEGTGFSEALVRRVSYLVGHHHTLTQIEGMDYQILIEADYLVNVDESHYDKDNIRNMYEKVFRTGTGKELLQNIYLCNPSLI
ncbi:MAG: HD domain-containing protein [Lachnospiraceae bacterium]